MNSTDDGSRLIDDADLYICADLYNAATNGDFEMFKNYSQPLDHLLCLNKNTILHVYLNSPCERPKDFVEKVLGKCPQVLWRTNNHGTTPLHIAANYGHLEIVKVLIEEAKNPIHRDLETGEDEAVRRMLRLTNKQKETALHLAIRGKCLNVVLEILKHEDPHFTYTANEHGESPLYLAIDKNNDDDIAMEILNKFESPDCCGPNGRTAFHAAGFCFGSTDSFFDLLLSKLGSFVNQADESGWTPLHYAACFGNVDLVRQILGKDKHSAYATDKYRCRTALHIASCRRNVGVMEKIIEKCPECCEIRDASGWNVLHYAVISKSEKAVKLIMKNRSLVYLINERDTKGYTPLHLLVVSRPRSSLLSWIRHKSHVPSEFLENGSRSMFEIPDFIDDRKKHEEETLEWMKDHGTDPLGRKIVRKDWEEIENEINEKVNPRLENAKDSHLMAAALVATVTFAAAFTVPGGYISDGKEYSNLKGTPILSRYAAFRAFVVADAVAMMLSTSSVFIHFIMVMLGYKQRYYWLIRSAFWFIKLAMGAMVVAFVTGTYVVLAPSSMGLAVATCVIGLSFFLYVAYATIRLIFNLTHKAEYHRSSTTESVGQVLRSAPPYIFGTTTGVDTYFDASSLLQIIMNCWIQKRMIRLFKYGDFGAAMLEAFRRIRNGAIY